MNYLFEVQLDWIQYPSVRRLPTFLKQLSYGLVRPSWLSYSPKSVHNTVPRKRQ